MSKLLNSIRLLTIKRSANYLNEFNWTAMSPNRELSTSTEKPERAQNYLPQLPVADVRQTMARLKLAAKPFAKSEDELQNLYQIIDQFSAVNGVGLKLQLYLEHKASQTTNWLSHDWWTDKAYLEGRDPIIIWSNPGLVFPDLPKPDKPDRKFTAEYISRLIAGVIDFRNFLRNGGNPEVSPDDVSKRVDVCMDQYSKVFGTCRTPGNPADSIRFGTLDNDVVSIVISRLNKFYQISFPHTENLNLVLPDIRHAILTILSMPISSEALPIGSFTALERNDFATVYHLLDQNALKAINECEFIVNIDHVKNVDTFKTSYNNSIGKQILHSDIENIGNRWFDKTIQLIAVLNSDGNHVLGAGFCYEHTPAEGPPIVRLMEHTIKHMARFQAAKVGGDNQIKFDFHELPLVPESNKPRITSATEFSLERYSRLVNSLDLEVLEFKNYGKDFIKSLKFSPDSWIQVGISFAFYRLHGKVGACYESGSTRKFAFGRTDTIRSVTNELKNFFESPTHQTLIDAIESHKQVVKNALNGDGIDRILLGYNTTAQELISGKWKFGEPNQVKDSGLTESDYETIDKLYKNELFIRSKYYYLSTSQVATIFPNSFMCYGPLVRDGYGCCYNPSKSQITFAISAFTENNCGTSAVRYKEELESGLQLMSEIISKQSKL